MSTGPDPNGTSGTRYPDLFLALSAPFDPSEVKSRTQAGRKMYYITARTVMNRLDGILGPEGWWDAYEPHEHSVQCRLTIRLPDGSTLTKADAGGYAGMADQGDDDKSGYSDAFKRAAVKFGVGRYLYRDGVADLGQSDGDDTADPTPASAATSDPHPSDERPRPPSSGKGLFAACKDLEQKHECTVVKPLNDWAKAKNWPGRMIDWDQAQVEAAWAWVIGRLTPPADRSAPTPVNGVDLATLRRDLYGKCRHAASLVNSVPEPTNDQIKAEFCEIAGIYSPGLVVESIKGLNNATDLAGLLKAADKRIEDFEELPF